MTAARSLRVWMAETSTNVVALSKSTGVSRSYLSHLRHGRRVPGLALALKLEELTGGAVPARAWHAPSSTAPSANVEPKAVEPAAA